LVNAASGEWAARYEYGPFHELLRATGPLARVNPFLSATKYHDWETGLSYYGYRYYDSGSGRWLNRDPLGEAGGLNLYEFVGNDSVNGVDPLGLFWRFGPYVFGRVPEGIEADGRYTYEPYVNPGLRPRPKPGSEPLSYGGLRDSLLDDQGLTGFFRFKGQLADTAYLVLSITPQGTISVVVLGESLEGEKAGAVDRVVCTATSLPAMAAGTKAFQISGKLAKQLHGKTAGEIEAMLAKLCCPAAKSGVTPITDPARLLPAPRTVPGDPFHHIFPQRADLAAEFQARGINPHDFTMQIPKPIHQQIHSGGSRGGAWNQAWEDFFGANPSATATDVYKEAGRLIHQFQVPGGPAVPYPR
jgi:RHS repeat-associated protein